ncbi:MAG: phosphatase PAP2-related protein [Patescibacteria group bacterium]
MTWFKKFRHHWGILLKDKAFLISLFVGFGLLVAAYASNVLASTYNDVGVYNSVGDLLLDNIRTYNLRFSYTWIMYFIITMIFVYPIFFEPEIVPFSFKTFAMLMFLRSACILMTNLGPPEGFFYADMPISFDVLPDLVFRNDLFFSGHTAYPFLAFLIYKNCSWRWFFLLGSILEGATVLLMHIHYSIDVFAAFFFAFGIYSISSRIFSRLNVRFTDRIKNFKFNP